MEESTNTAKKEFILSDERKERIEKSIEAFNFEKVHAYMVLTDWKYSILVNKGFKYYSPSIDELKETVRDLIISCYKYLEEDKTEKGYAISSTGGFTVEVFDENIHEYGPYIWILFSIEESNAF